MPPRLSLTPLEAADLGELAALVFAAEAEVERCRAELVAKLRELHDAGRGSTATLGAAIGVSKATVHLAVTRDRRVPLPSPEARP